MGSALFTGVTGLQAHQEKLDVVASNIANVNTIGYRSSRVLFQDLFSETLRGGSAPVGTSGGANPMQVGLGVTSASIDVDYSDGSLLTTGVSSDLAIQGNGFFLLSDGTKTAYTRDGSFSLNANGYLVEPATGMYVRGYMADSQGNINTNVVPQNISIPVGGTGIVRATTTATMIGNLDANADAATSVVRTFQVYDSQGTARNVKLTFTKQATPANTWSWTGEYTSATGTATTVGSGTLTFQSDGTLPTGTTGSITIPGTVMNDTGSQPSDLTASLDYSAITQLSAGSSATSDVTLKSQDGFARGVLQSYNIGANGEINGVFSNGLTRVIAQVALGSFSNVGGLVRDGDNMFLETPASGTAQVGTPGSGGRGSVTGGVLENSNVDLSKEFSNLIITQRGYQANARTITAADTILQETVNLVR
jgi:flagellar hook protein FlgE